MINDEDWQDFVEHRKEIKKPMTERAEKRMLKKLERLAREGHDPAEVIDRSIINGWQDVFPLPIEQQRQQGNQQAASAFELVRKAVQRGSTTTGDERTDTAARSVGWGRLMEMSDFNRKALYQAFCEAYAA